jgi:hypothetical protein
MINESLCSNAEWAQEEYNTRAPTNQGDLFSATLILIPTCCTVIEGICRAFLSPHQQDSQILGGVSSHVESCISAFRITTSRPCKRTVTFYLNFEYNPGVFRLCHTLNVRRSDSRSISDGNRLTTINPTRVKNGLASPEATHWKEYQVLVWKEMGTITT